jgi:NAD(P)H-quinone oxidoreductase subunit 5
VAWGRIGAVAAALPAGPALAVAVLLVLACASRAAQVPFHGWLPMTLAAPTPVSAIMHAGVVNAAAFLVIRSAEAVTAQPLAMALLGILGSASMVRGAAGYLVRADLKGRLVASTTAQMGVMLVALSVGAWGAALFHLIGHGVYKARLFLRAGDGIDAVRRAQEAPRAEPVSARMRAVASAAAVVVPGAGILAAMLLVRAPLTSSGVLLAAYGWTTAGVLLHGALTSRAWPVAVRLLLLPGAAAAAAAYAVVVHAVDALVSSGIPAAARPDPGWTALVPLLLVGAISLLPRLRTAGSARLYGWATLLAGSPVPRLRPVESPRPRPATSAPIIQELA